MECRVDLRPAAGLAARRPGSAWLFADLAGCLPCRPGWLAARPSWPAACLVDGAARRIPRSARAQLIARSAAPVACLPPASSPQQAARPPASPPAAASRVVARSARRRCPPQSVARSPALPAGAARRNQSRGRPSAAPPIASAAPPAHRTRPAATAGRAGHSAGQRAARRGCVAEQPPFSTLPGGTDSFGLGSRRAVRLSTSWRARGRPRRPRTRGGPRTARPAPRRCPSAGRPGCRAPRRPCCRPPGPGP
ncbi:hypothetical protein SAMN04489727_9567 [Amycolatopsis tolypomycina]|uniref:Uncharacterized protein n=1 Tax=Amycolatopsis tolypomycina TaxID=208445 RepID=A0A1H5DSX9_9PSEU|nr:hypothetical protein SAMN04489727_9567 [Amycolatopsis tolypomycina]